VIRPISTAADPRELMTPVWVNNRLEADRLRSVFRIKAEDEYRGYNVLKGDLSPEIVDDLDTLLKGEATIIAITDPDQPEKIQQIVSVAYDGTGGLPHERRFHRTFFQRQEPDWQLSDKRFVEAWGAFDEIPLNSLLLSIIPTFEGEPSELKTLIRAQRCTTDWIPLIMRTLIATEAIRHGSRPIGQIAPPDMRQFAAQIEAKIRKYDPDILMAARGDRAIAERMKHSIRDRAYAKSTQRTVGIDKIVGEVHGRRLVDHYVEEYGFSDTGIVLKLGSDPDHWVYLIAAKRAALENHIVDGFGHRPGLEIALANQYHLVDNARIPLQPCALEYSQLNTEFAAVLGTRGTILGGGGFQLW
jgi:hypothetical protein